MLLEDTVDGSRQPKGTAGALHVVEQNENPAERAFTTWALGDDTAAVSISASASSVAADIDCTLINRTHGTIVIVLAGSGTAKVNVKGGRDGVNDLIDFGDILTGKTAGVHFIALTNTALAYAHHLLVTVTETGGANAVTAKVFLMGRGG